MKIVIIDNYDSFTYNLSHLVKELGAEVTVMRNDSFKLEELKVFDKIILSPGPGIPYSRCMSGRAGHRRGIRSQTDQPE